MRMASQERVNVYDAAGRVAGALPRGRALSSGRPVGAVNALVVSARGQVLLQLRRKDKENGGLWDKTVGGHVGAGESFDACIVREAGEELFGDGASGRVRLLASRAAVRRRPWPAAPAVVIHRVGLQLNLRDVRRLPGGGFRTVLYHVALYLGRTAAARAAFRPDPSELAGLRFFAPTAVDRMLLQGRLAPNMAFLWLTLGRALLDLARR
jgi:8-oxo-dGTP pyrophosphatase MutT (NUDIX family)